MVIWGLDMTINQVVWDDQCRRLFGLTSTNQVSYEQVIQYIHPQDVEQVRQAALRVMSPCSTGCYDETYRTIGADDGQLRWVRFYGRSYFTDAGERLRFAGVAQEATAQIQAQQSLQAAYAR